MAAKEVVVQDVIQLLKNGYTRWTKDEEGHEGSIQTHYDLSFTDAKTLFAHEKIKNLKVIIPTMVIIDRDDTNATTAPVAALAPTAVPTPAFVPVPTDLQASAAPAAPAVPVPVPAIADVLEADPILPTATPQNQDIEDAILVEDDIFA